MSLALKLLLGPVLLWQGRRVRQRAIQLPEAAGPRQGAAGQGAERLSLLVLGDSAAAGVGASHQDDALAASLARLLAQALGGRVRWQVLACTGHTAADALAHLRDATLAPVDLLVCAVGVNDVVGQTPPARWLGQLDELHGLAASRLGARFTLHAGLPPMGEFALLPQPLRWVLGHDARRLDSALQGHLAGQTDRAFSALPRPPAGVAVADWMASDGYHPGPPGYQHWASALTGQILAEVWPRLRPDRPGE